MLVLKRAKGQKLLINDNITITVTKIEPDAVKLGVEAPKHVRVYRDEIKGIVPSASEGVDQEINRLREAVMLLSQKLGWTALQTDEWMANL